MLVKIDWLSFTGSRIVREDETEQSALYDVNDIMAADDIVRRAVGVPLIEFNRSKGRAPYSLSLSRLDSGAFIFLHPRLSHFLIELSGRGCDAAMKDGLMWKLLFGVRLNLFFDFLFNGRFY